ncbi:hypothetical protein M2347_000719 [Chryseobacterium sp. H1D6B]|uniref:outer membrane beta-barrel protein n=1 Tax=Chryseobacterium sp. H1D6B TaxID=2940588 RepID=UPI0015CD6B90|nr:outer membrane beta-barrel protein [Chryseobacterium sp. H1D6B]MDH6250992.1 hypothetical protein [Chryseobacterium sp. H1D6B]
MKKSFVLILIMITFSSLYSQKAKITAGGGISKINSSTGPVFDKSVFVFSGGVGLDWFEKENFYISSEVGYTQMGGKETNPSLPQPYDEMEKKWGFIYLSSTFRYKIPVDKSFFFIGAGPKLNFSLDSSSAFKNTIYDGGYNMKSLNIGLLTEVGYMHDWDKFRAGIVGSYLIGISPVASTEFSKLKSNPLFFSLSFGFNL